MTSLKGSEWGGVFRNPIIKHRNHPNTRHPGHLVDHIGIVDITPLDDDEIEAYDEDFESDYSFDQLTQLGDGPVAYLVRIGFLPDTGEDTYDYVVWADADTETAKEQAKELIASDLTPRGG